MANHFRNGSCRHGNQGEVNEDFAKKVRDPCVQGVTITDVQMLG